MTDLSPDGRWLVFDSDRSGNAELYRLAVSGGEPVQLTSDPAGDFSAAWSPDGQRIVFHSLRTGNRDLFTMNADGSRLAQRTSAPTHELDADWSPDGDWLVAEVLASEDLTTTEFALFPVDSTRGPVRRMSVAGDFAVWSPAGDQIAYHAGDGIRVFSPEGGQTTLLGSNGSDGTEAYYAAWSPDGRILYYLARGPVGWMIRAVSREGGPSRVLVRFDDPSRQPAAYGFTTDGRTFYFTLGSRESDLLVAELTDRP